MGITYVINRVVVMKYLILFLVCTNLQAFTWIDEYQAVQAYEKSDYHKAGQVFQKVLSQNPGELKNLANMGNILYREGKFLEAVNYFEQALKARNLLEEQKKELLFNLGSSYAQQEKWQEALNAYENLIKLDPDNLRVTKNIEIIKKLLEKQQQEKQEQSEKHDQQNQAKNQDQEQQDLDSGEQDQQKKSENSGNNDKQDSKQADKPDQPDKSNQQANPDEKQDQGQQSASEKKQQQDQAQELMQKLDEKEKAYLQAVEQNDQRANTHLMKMQMQQLKGQNNESENNW